MDGWGEVTGTPVLNNISLDHVLNDTDYDFKNLIFNDTEENDSSPYHNIGHSCSYFEQSEFQEKVKNISKQISTFSQNIRSLPNKFSELSEQISYLNQNKFKFTVIGLQEIWSVPSGMQFNLNGYKPFHFTTRDPTGQNRNAGGGVGLFIDDNFEFEEIKEISIFEPYIFESQFIKLKTSKTKFTIIGNIYRPNTAPLASSTRFNEILANILTTIKTDPVLKKADDVQLIGDTNLNVLNFKTHYDTRAYLDTLINFNQLPLITLPTRVTDTSATVIDHICTSHRTDFYDAGIILSSLSDHFPFFYIKHTYGQKAPPKWIKSRKINNVTIPGFKHY